MKRLVIYKYVVLLSLLCFSYGEIKAQQDPLFTHYLTNRLVVNPAYAGSTERLVANTLYRTQWVDIDGAPDTYTVSVHGSFPGRRVGLGLYYQQDMIGPTVSHEVVSNYAYHILMNRSKLSFGLSFGFKHMSLDWTQMNFYDSSEPVLESLPGAKWKPNFNVGVYYTGPNYYAGLSSKELLQSEYFSVDGNANYTSYKLHQHVYLVGGYIFPVAERITLRPSMLVKWVYTAPLEVDVNFMAFFSERLAIGASYRTTSAISGLVQIGLTNQIFLGYSYDHYFNELQWVNTGSHEIMLEFNLEMFNSKLKTPRFF